MSGHKTKNALNFNNLNHSGLVCDAMKYIKKCNLRLCFFWKKYDASNKIWTIFKDRIHALAVQ